MTTVWSLLIPYYGDLGMIKKSRISFYNNTGYKLMELLFSQLFVSKGLAMLLDIIYVAYSYCRTSGAPNRPSFHDISSYSIAIYIFYTVTALGTQYPVLYIPGFLYFVLHYLTDTFLLLFLYEKSPGDGHTQFVVSTFFTLLFSSIAVISSPALSGLFQTLLSLFLPIFTLLAFFILYMTVSYLVNRSLENLIFRKTEDNIKPYEQPQLARICSDVNLLWKASYSSDIINILFGRMGII